MENLFEISDRERVIERLSLLQLDAHPKWGTMTAHQMIVHVTDPFRAALGEKETVPLKKIFGLWPFNKLISQLLPWPKGAPTSPDFIQGKGGTAPADFEDDKRSLLLLIHRFIQEGQTPSQLTAHAVFGRLTNREWGRLMWRHIDHHLRQFGL
ncbi:MAG: DUF1569 domain-containing protein [Ignavibacteriae bacterium]|nr:DUF1569 domain-containing protein [Ignavibacteriota bacterium]MCB9215750.1 DUF1569 domain-containing protein [Ignavibacteria bacterium]